jgi:DNA-binding HxlR family transcriptional regulator
MVEHPLDNCPIARTARLIGDAWTLLIVRDLMRSNRRFGELEASLHGISPKTLSQRVEYELTVKGRALIPIIEAMQQFGEEYADT